MERIHRSSISFATGEWMVVPILEDNGRLVVHLCELACDESDDPMFEVVRIIDEDRLTGIYIL